MKPAWTFLAALATHVSLQFQPAIASTPPRPIPGYKCMMLNLTEQEVMNPAVHIVVRSGPSSTSPSIGWASSVVIVKEAATPVNGYLPMLFSTGREVWIDASAVKPFRSASDPSARCVPVLLPNGLVGISSN